MKKCIATQQNAVFALLARLLVIGVAVFSTGLLPVRSGLALQPGSCLIATSATLQIADVAPRSVYAATATVVTVYGSGFANTAVVDLLGVGLLPTEFVDSTLLKATLPSTLAPGRYSLIVRDTASQNCSNVFDGINAVAATTAESTAVPATPMPGQPVLVVRGYSVQPDKINAGDEFEVAFDLYNTGSRAAENTLVTFPSGAFIPIGSNNGFLLGQVHINATVSMRQRFRAPATMASGAQEVKLSFSANDWEGRNFVFNATVPIEVIGLATPMPGRPNLVIESTANEPETSRTGETMTVTMMIANRGNRMASNILVTVNSADVATPADGSNATSVRGLAVGQLVKVWQPLTINAKNEAGRKTIEVVLDYTDPAGTSYSTKQTIGIDVTTRPSKRPQVLLPAYRTQPQFIHAGEPFTLSLQLKNLGNDDAQRLVVTLGGENGNALKPFALLGSGSTQFIDVMSAGAQLNLEQAMIVDGNADPATYNLPVLLVYEDSRGTKLAETQIVSLLVRRRPQVRVALSGEASDARLREPLQLSIDIYNIGRKPLNVSTVDLTSANLEVPVKSHYLGVLGESTSSTIDVTVIPTQTGQAELTVHINYLDDFNQPQSIEQSLEIEVQDQIGTSATELSAPTEPSSTPEGETVGSFLLRLLRGLFGLGS